MSANSVGVIIYYDKRVRYSLNALIASIDLASKIRVLLVEKPELLPSAVKYVSDKFRGKCVLGFSLLTTMLVDDVFLDFIMRVNRYVKGKCYTVAGGPHASGDPVGSIEKLGFDYVFIGEAEKSFKEFLETMAENGDILSVSGLFTKVYDNFVFTGKPKPINLDEYHPFPYWRMLFNPIEITRGCPYGCNYCQVSYMHGFCMRHRSIERIAYYVEIMAKHGLRDVRFISPNSLSYGSNTPKKPCYDSIEELLYTIKVRLGKKYGLRVFFGTFPSEVRPDYVDEEVARILRKYVDNDTIIIGAQSGSEEVLKRIRRGHSFEEVINAVDILKKYGFKSSVDFIVGLPGESEEDLELTLNAMKKLANMGARIHLHTFMPLPGTPFAYTTPTRVPEWFKREVVKLIGSGSAYGEWVRQEYIAWKIVELRRKGVILPRVNTNIHSSFIG